MAITVVVRLNGSLQHTHARHSGECRNPEDPSWAGLLFRGNDEENTTVLIRFARTS